MKIKLPFVSRKVYDRDLKNCRSNLSQQRIEYEKDLEKLSTRLDEIIPQVLNITFRRTRKELPNFRLAVEIDPNFVYDALVHGGDRQMIQFIVAKISRQIERELNTLNFARFKDFG